MFLVLKWKSAYLPLEQMLIRKKREGEMENKNVISKYM